MKKITLTIFGLAIILIGVVLAADHIDAPAVQGTSSDITDYYAFRSPENTNNLVFVANVQGLLSPTNTASAQFDESVMIEFNIDNSGDLVEDLVIQALIDDGALTTYGPVAPTTTGTESIVESDGIMVTTPVTTYGNAAMVGNNEGIRIFAGPRDDPFFMDFAQYQEIIAGNATGFNNPGSDTFAGTNVMSIVVEVPKSMLGNAETLNTWVETKRAR